MQGPNMTHLAPENAQLYGKSARRQPGCGRSHFSANDKPGARAAMDRVATVAQALGLTFSRLSSPYPFHSSQLVPVAKAFRTAIARQARKGTRTRNRFPTGTLHPIVDETT